MLTRRTFIGRMLAGAVVLGGFRAPGARAATVLRHLSVRNAAKSFVGDRRLSPRSAHAAVRPRGGAILDLVSDQPVAATLEVVNRNGVGATSSPANRSRSSPAERDPVDAAARR